LAVQEKFLKKTLIFILYDANQKNLGTILGGFNLPSHYFALFFLLLSILLQ
jgi:hypothetical protein